MQTSYLLLATVLAVSKANKLQVSPLAADKTLRAAVKNAEPLFSTHIAAGLEQLPGIPVAKASLLGRHDFFFQINSDKTLDLTNVHVVSGPHFKVSSVRADLEYLNMAVEGSVGTVVVDGNFSISSPSSYKTSPVVSEGSFRLVFESVAFKGYTGLRVAGDTLLTENYDIHYVPAAVILTAQHLTAHGPVNSQISISTFDDAVSAKIKARLRSRMNRHLKKHLDAVASECSLSELLLHDDTAITSFMSHSRSMTISVNGYIDALLADMIKRQTNAERGTISIPAEIHASFSKKILWVRWHGSFTATDAWAKDITTIHRTGDMSIKYDEGVLTVFGSLGFSHLEGGFGYWRAEFMGIGPKGTLSAKVGYNSLFVNVAVDLNDLSHPTATIHELQIEEIDDIDVKVTGLGILGWLLSQIASWLLDFFTDPIANAINKHLHDLADTSITFVNPLHYLQ